MTVQRIDSNNVDFYQWGKNCAILGLTLKEAENCFYTEVNTISENFDDFFDGYYSNK
jgi:hypothetical protein